MTGQSHALPFRRTSAPAPKSTTPWSSATAAGTLTAAHRYHLGPTALQEPDRGRDDRLRPPPGARVITSLPNEVRALIALVAVLLLTGAPTARADTASSSNWSGYAVHRTGTRFRTVSAEWRVPSARCTAGQSTYSAMWVGLGGYNSSAQVLEQTGTETDCSSSGRPVYSAWYELVPTASRAIPLAVRPADLIKASVKANGSRVTITLDDLSDHRGFSRTLTASQVDTSSAEWILEAPADCSDSGSCQTLPLAHFAAATFEDAHVETTQRRAGSVLSRWWDATSIALSSGSQGFISQGGGSGRFADGAVPSALSRSGSSFSVTHRSKA